MVHRRDAEDVSGLVILAPLRRTPTESPTARLGSHGSYLTNNL
jgi:hypothetical protein